MRVALVSEHASPLAAVGSVDAGGQNVHVAELAAGLVRLGHQVTVYTRRDDPDTPDVVRAGPGYLVDHLTAGPAATVPKDELWPHLPAFASALQRRLTHAPADLLHAHFWMSAWATRTVADRLGLPVVVTFHALGTVKRRHQGIADTSPAERIDVEREVARRADRVLATCADEVAELTALAVPAAHVSIVPCGVDLRHFTPEPTSASPIPARTQRYRLLGTGRLVPRKGFEVAIEALAAIPDTELLIAGGQPRGDSGLDEERDRLAQLATRHGVGHRVRLLGQVPRSDVPALLRSADVVVCTPWYEPFGLVPLEAMACGVPVVGSAVGGLLDSIADGVTGRLVPPRDPQALAAVLRSLLADRPLRACYGEAGRRRAAEHYSWDEVARRTAAVYDDVLCQRAVSAWWIGRARAVVAGRSKSPIGD